MKSTDKNKIGIIGVGKLGLPYALALSYKQDYVDQLKNKIVDTQVLQTIYLKTFQIMCFLKTKIS